MQKDPRPWKDEDLSAAAWNFYFYLSVVAAKSDTLRTEAPKVLAGQRDFVLRRDHGCFGTDRGYCGDVAPAAVRALEVCRMIMPALRCAGRTGGFSKTAREGQTGEEGQSQQEDVHCSVMIGVRCVLLSTSIGR
jgi:hypothetical protein